MNRLVAAAVLLFALPLAAAAPDKADFPLTVHVVYSRMEPRGQSSYQQIDALVDGKKMELTGGSLGVLALGDYPARVSKKIHSIGKPNGYDLYVGYDLLLSDGHVRTFTMTAIGDAGWFASGADAARH